MPEYGGLEYDRLDYVLDESGRLDLMTSSVYNRNYRLSCGGFSQTTCTTARLHEDSAAGLEF